MVWVPIFMVVHSTQVYILLKPLFSRHKGIGVQFTDEPTGNLDSRTSQEVLGLLKSAADTYRQTLVMITHNPDIAQMADRVVRMEDGKILERVGRQDGK